MNPTEINEIEDNTNNSLPQNDTSLNEEDIISEDIGYKTPETKDGKTLSTLYLNVPSLILMMDSSPFNVAFFTLCVNWKTDDITKWLT